MNKQFLFVGLILCGFSLIPFKQLNAQIFNAKTGTHTPSITITKPPTVFLQNGGAELAFNINIVKSGYIMDAEFKIKSIEFDLNNYAPGSGSINGTLKIYKYNNSNFYQSFSTGASCPGNPCVISPGNLTLIHTQAFSNLSYSNAAVEKININGQVIVKNNTGLLVVINPDTWGPAASGGTNDFFVGVPSYGNHFGVYYPPNYQFNKMFGTNCIWAKIDFEAIPTPFCGEWEIVQGTKELTAKVEVNNINQTGVNYFLGIYTGPAKITLSFKNFYNASYAYPRMPNSNFVVDKIFTSPKNAPNGITQIKDLFFPEHYNCTKAEYYHAEPHGKLYMEWESKYGNNQVHKISVQLKKSPQKFGDVIVGGSSMMSNAGSFQTNCN